MFQLMSGEHETHGGDQPVSLLSRPVVSTFIIQRWRGTVVGLI